MLDHLQKPLTVVVLEALRCRVLLEVNGKQAFEVFFSGAARGEAVVAELCFDGRK